MERGEVVVEEEAPAPAPEAQAQAALSATVASYRIFQPTRRRHQDMWDEDDLYPYAVWEVAVRDHPGARGDYSLHYTYEQFAALDSEMRKRHRNTPLAFLKEKFAGEKRERVMPDFPSRAWLRDELDPAFLSQRQSGLDRYLALLLRDFSDDLSLQAFLAPPVERSAPVSRAPAARFPAPRASVAVPERVGDVWLHALLDTMRQSLSSVNGVWAKVHAREGDVAYKLHVLEASAERLRAAEAMLRESSGPLRAALEDPSLPHGLASYLDEMLRVTSEASDWAANAEERALLSLSQEGAVAEEAPAMPEEMPRCVEQANAMVVEALAVRDEAQVRDLKERKARFLRMCAERNWEALAEFVETNVVPSVSLRGVAGALEERLIGLVTQRSALASGDTAGASDLMRNLRDLRRTLQSFKTELKGETTEDPAFIASLQNAITDLQDNACSLELEVEQNFELEEDLQDAVVARVRQKRVEVATRQAQSAQDSLFEL